MSLISVRDDMQPTQCMLPTVARMYFSIGLNIIMYHLFYFDTKTLIEVYQRNILSLLHLEFGHGFINVAELNRLMR